MTFTLPAEWHPQSAIQLTWPHHQTDWQPWLSDIEQTYLDIITAIVEFELVVIACHNDTIAQRVMSRVNNVPNKERVKTFIAPCNDTWARDHGPITLVDEQGQTRLLDFTFNAWGAKYQANLDDKITLQLIQQPFVNLNDYQNIDFILEGGSIESDGAGTILTTETCLLNENRNPNLNKEQIDKALKELLNVKQVIWLTHGHLPGDDTDAHIDTLARFCPEGIIYVTNDDPNSLSYNALQLMEQELQQTKNATGQPYRLFPLPSPDTITNSQGDPLPATYANFLIINQAVLVPLYGDKQDENALASIQSAFPTYKIVGINCRTVIEQYGSLHCLTMQLPKGLINE